MRLLIHTFLGLLVVSAMPLAPRSCGGVCASAQGALAEAAAASNAPGCCGPACDCGEAADAARLAVSGCDGKPQPTGSNDARLPALANASVAASLAVAVDAFAHPAVALASPPALDTPAKARESRHHDPAPPGEVCLERLCTLLI